MAITVNGAAGAQNITQLSVGTSADLASIISDESGTGVIAFTTLPTFGGTGVKLSGSTSGTTTVISGATAGASVLTLPVATDTLVGKATTDTFTNKTLTSPVLGGTTTTASGNLVLDPATKIVEVKGDGASIVGQIQLNCHVNTHGQKIASQPHSESATNVLTLPGGTAIGNSNAVLVSDIGTQTITNKTLTSPVINSAVIKSPEERLTVTATAATGTVNYDALTQGVLFFTTDASANWTLNVRGDGSTTLNDSLVTGDSITIVFLVTQGATAYYSSALTIDGSAVTPKFIGGTAFSAGNASSIDSYVYTIIKTGSATFTVLASQTKFA